MRGRGQYVADIRLAGPAGRRLRPQPAGACPHQGHPCAGALSRCRLHRGRSDRRQADPRRVRPARFQDLRAAGARDRQGAPRRRAGRHVRGADAGRGRGYRRRGDARLRRASGRLRHAARRATPARALVHEHWGDNVFLESVFEVDITPALRCADQGNARNIDRAAMHVAARRPRRRRDLRSPPRPAHALYRRADAAHRAQRPVRLSRHRAGPDPHRLARYRRRLRPQGNSAARRSLPRLARDAQRPCRCAGSRTAASI